MLLSVYLLLLELLQTHAAPSPESPESDTYKRCWDDSDFGWDGMRYTIGYDVAADLKIVQWPTTFLTQL